MADSSQKFIGRNRPPRVQIDYDVELYGAEKKVELPFVMGVMADLAGKPGPDDEVVPVDERKFMSIDADNFNDRLQAIKPHVAFDVPNMLTGEGNMKVDMTFESMDDFSPEAIAKNVEGLKQLLEARNQLEALLTHMDGKSGAEEAISKLIQDESQLRELVAAAKSSDSDDAPASDTSEGEE